MCHNASVTVSATATSIITATNGFHVTNLLSGVNPDLNLKIIALMAGLQLLCFSRYMWLAV